MITEVDIPCIYIIAVLVILVRRMCHIRQKIQHSVVPQKTVLVPECI